MLLNLFQVSTIVLLGATFFQLPEIVTPRNHTAGRSFASRTTPKFSTKWHNPARRNTIRSTPRSIIQFTTPKVWTSRIRTLTEIRITTPKIRITPKTSSRIRSTTPKIRTTSKRRIPSAIRFTTPKIRTTPRIRYTTSKIRTTPRIRSTTPRTRTTFWIRFATEKNHGRFTTASPKTTTTKVYVTRKSSKVDKQPSKTKKPLTTTKKKEKLVLPKPVFYPPPDLGFHRLNVGPNYYQPHPQLQPLLNMQSPHPVIINNPVFVSPGLYRHKEDYTLLGTYIGQKTQNLIHHDSTYNATYRNTSYAVIHHNHYYDKPIPREIQVEEHTLGKCGNLSVYCPPTTSALCLRNATVFCITSINLTKPCNIDSKTMSCFTAKIPCSKNTRCRNPKNEVMNVTLPCISRIRFPQNFSQKYSVFSNKTEVFIVAKSNVTSTTTRNDTNETKIENLRRTFRKILVDLINIPGINSSLNQSLLSDITLLINESANVVKHVHPNSNNTAILGLAGSTVNEKLLTTLEINKTELSLFNKTTGILDFANENGTASDLEYLRRKYIQTLINITNVVGSKTYLGQAILTNITQLIGEAPANCTNTGTAINGSSVPLTNATTSLTNRFSTNFTNATPSTNHTFDGVTNITTSVNETSTELNRLSVNLTNITLPINGCLTNLTDVMLLNNRSSANFKYPSRNKTMPTTNHTWNTNPRNAYETNNNEFCVVLIAEPQPRRRKMTNADFINYTNKNQDFSSFVNAKGRNILNRFIGNIFF